jgi:hypothetical protein
MQQFPGCFFFVLLLVFFFYTISYCTYIPKSCGVVNKFTHSLQPTIFICPSKDGTYYVMVLSVRPWSFTVFQTFLVIFTAIGLKLGVLLCSQELLFQFAFQRDGFIFARVMPLELSRISDFSFPDFFSPSLQL